LALGQIAASNVATAMLLREFRARSDFEFFNTIGQRQTSAQTGGMSALPQGTDIELPRRHLR
jgi:hypothetical protein